MLAFLAGCAAVEAPPRDVPIAAQKLYQIERGPLFVAQPQKGGAASSASNTAEAAVRFARGVSPDDRGVDTVEVAAAPILYGSPEGQEFLVAQAARAFSIGAPPANCPARAAGTGPTAVSAAEDSLRRCFARMEAARPEGGGDCGCLVVALGDLIVAPSETLSYAKGVSTRVIGPDPGEESYLVAEEVAGDDGARLLAFRPAGAAASGRLVASVAPDGAARALWRENGAATEDIAFEGRRIGDGLRRGRYAERLYLEDAAGRRIIVLIGYEPVEYAVKKRELLAWPRG